MSIMFFLILVSLVVALGFLAAFLWATRAGQFDDGLTPSIRILFDDKPGASATAGESASTTSTNSSNSTETGE